MSNFVIIYVAINLVLVYLYLSMVASIVQEWFARIVALRSKTLRSGIGTLLKDPDFVGIAHRFFNHGLIKGISSNSRGPSYIPGPLFASVLLDLVAPTQLGGPPNVFATVRGEIAALPANDPSVSLRNSLLTLADNSEESLAKLHVNVANWFDSAMDRVSGQYKRYAQLVLFLTGLALAGVFNADTLRIASLSATPQSSETTDQVISKIKQSANVGPTAVNQPIVLANSDRDELIATLTPVLPLGWCKPPTPALPTSAPTVSSSTLSSACSTKASSINACLVDLPEGLDWIQKAFGLLITAVMVSLGAPFWFDILSSVMNVRFAGPRPGDPQATSN